MPQHPPAAAETWPPLVPSGHQWQIGRGADSGS